MIPTPNLSHLTSSDYEKVYEPAEDTFLLLDALEQDEQFLRDLCPSVCLEVGSGSGCVSTFLGTILKASSLYICTDINPHACRCTSCTGTQNGINLDVVNTSFTQSLTSRLSKRIDVILFNPPYVPTVHEEAADAQTMRGIQGSWAGGDDGMHVTNKFLDCVDELLSPRGVFYLVALKQNNITDIQQRMRDSYTIDGQVVLQRRAGKEHLFIIRFCRVPYPSS